ncbi:LPXTG cell wall anchor domain-containing protein [Cryobacterium melibiosiphilum]|uniref:LPXTG cell wall anchor domain-containing protein n=2 Tax=Cryobacterium melibiosiphilum TaxID=995039 RepID=A0A3A5MTS3_9MICO|nr:LPXTG cell wall anchor domain-containing protein [Cryobacterium melibiosiphilum]
MADVLGQVSAGVIGSTSASSPANGSTASGTQGNHALVSLPYATVSGGTTVVQSTGGIGVRAPDSRYYALGMSAVGTRCGTNNASLSLNLVSGTTTLLAGFPSPVVPCTSTGSVFYTSPTLPTFGTVSGIVDPAWSASVRAATYNGSNTALLTPAQISASQVQLLDTVTGTGSGFGVDNIRVLDVTPALDVAFDPAAATATVPTTLTYTITNTTDLFAKTDWGFSTALPQGLAVAPNPTVAGTCTNAAGSAFSVTGVAGSGSIAAVGGDLPAGASSCTISVAVVAGGAGTYASGTVTPSGLITSPPTSLTVAAATTITVRKNLPARTATADQFTLSLRTGTTVLASATTTGTATGIQAAQISRSVVQPGSTYTIHETQTSGAGLGYSNAYECTRAGTVIASGSGASGTITVPDEVGTEVVCTFTNITQTARLVCDTNHFYSITAAGALEQGDIVSGLLAPVGTWAGATAANALGVGSDGNIAYALDRSADGSDVASILKWTPGSGYQKLVNTSYTTVAGGAQVDGSIVAGAIDLASGRYLFGTFANSQFYLWSFTESNPAATRFAFVGAVPTGAAPNGNGDMAFDARGNLYVVGAATVNSTSGATIYTVTAETLAAASGGTLVVSASTTKPLTGTDAAFANVNGIAFSPRGTVYLSNAGSVYEFDATTWRRVNGTPRVAVNSVDLAGCSSPPTITVQKNVVGRQAASDQFTLTASAGSPLTVFATATTTGTTTGRQIAQIGPFPTSIGNTITISETMAAGSAISAYTTIYECWVDGVRLSAGTTTTGTVTMPNRLSANVNCTYFNSPSPVSSVRITKTIREFSGLTRPGVDWSVGTTAAATTGTATVLPSGASRQQTDAAGQASWTVLFGGAASRATVVVSEVQQEGFAFVSGSCTVNGATRPATFTQAGSIFSASLTAITPSSVIECTIVNRPTASLTLVKEVAFGSALPTDWTLSATGPTGALPGPSGRSGTAAASGIPVTPGVAYRLAEAGGPRTYVQTDTWQCLTGTGATIDVTDAGDVIPTTSATITCTVTNATASITLLTQVQNPQTGFQAPDWRVTATPAALTGGVLATESRLGAEYVTAGNPANTFDVRPLHSYTFSEAAVDPAGRLAYQELRLEQLTGSAWTPVSSRTISAPAAGQTAVYRFVNAPVEPTRLPLTGGTSADAFYIGGGLLLILAFALSMWHRRRRIRGTFRWTHAPALPV